MADDDLGLPKSTLLKAIKEQLPADVRLGGAAADALLRCCNEFVLMVSASANEISERQKRSTIMPDHIVEALRELGFDEYLDAVTEGAPAAGHRRRPPGAAQSAACRLSPVACRLSPVACRLRLRLRLRCTVLDSNTNAPSLVPCLPQPCRSTRTRPRRRGRPSATARRRGRGATTRPRSCSACSRSC
jgi:histone H3/H4